MKEDTGTRLRQVRKHFGYSQQKMANAIGISQAAWANAEKGINNLKLSNLKKLENELNINLDYLETGVGSVLNDEVKGIKGLSEVKLISGSVLAGLSEMNPIQSHNVEEVLYLPLGKDKNYYAIKVEGRSMEPGIKESSTVIMQEMKDKSEFVNNKIYVIIFQGVAFVKRIEMLLQGTNKGKFEVKSDNEEKIQIVGGKDISVWYKVICVLNHV